MTYTLTAELDGWVRSIDFTEKELNSTKADRHEIVINILDTLTSELTESVKKNLV